MIAAANEITHPDKLLFPADGISKGEVAAYYKALSAVMLPHLRGRPVTLERFPAGIEKKGFMQKDVSKGFPPWLERVEVEKRGGTLHHALIGDERSLAWLANQNCITPHVWSSRVPALDAPDLCLFDLDPSRDDAAELRVAALAVRGLLEELGLRSWVKTSGSKGFHIVVPLEATSFETAWHFAHAVGAVLVRRHPAQLTQEFLKTERAGRILIDTGRNGHSATFAAAYALRPKPGAPVSAPCTWQEVESGLAAPQSFRLRTQRERVERVGDLWADLHERAHALAGPLAKVRAMLSAEEWDESLAAITRRPKPRKKSNRGER
jgi:bifunctional non-homologous end joining protein LigD